MRSILTSYDCGDKGAFPKNLYDFLGRLMLVFGLVIFIAAGSAMGQGKPQPQGQLTPGAEPLPDEAIMAANKALDNYLGGLASNIIGDKDPGGNVRGRTTKQGLVLVQKIYMKDLTNYSAWIASLQAQSDADKIKLIHKLRQDADGVNEAYGKMQWAASGFNPLTVDRSAFAEKNRYDAFLRDAAFEEEHGNLERAAMLRQFAKESNWGTFLPFRERFLRALDQNPLLGVKADGDYLFRILQTKIDYRASDKDLLPLLEKHLEAFFNQTNAERDRVSKMEELTDLWELGTYRYIRQQQEAAQLGPLAQKLIAELQSVNAAYLKTEAAQDAWKDIALSLVVAGTALIPVVGPLAGGAVAAIQVYRDGSDLVVAYVEDANVKNAAGVLGYVQQAETGDRLADARTRTLFSLGMAAAQVPGVRDALKQGANIRFVRQRGLAMRATASTANAAASTAEDVLSRLTVGAERFGQTITDGKSLARFFTENGLAPQRTVQIGGKTFHLSAPFQGPGGRAAIIAFEETSSGVVPRTFYLSNEHGIWRAAAGFGVNPQTGEALISKGPVKWTVVDPKTGVRMEVSEAQAWGNKTGKVEFVNEGAADIAAELQGPLFEDLNQNGIKQLPPDAAKTAFTGHLENTYALSPGKEFEGAIEAAAGGPARKAIEKPFVFEPGARPDFANGLKSRWTFEHPLYGHVEGFVFQSEDGNTLYMVLRGTDGNGVVRVWVPSIQDAKASVGPFGTRLGTYETDLTATPFRHAKGTYVDTGNAYQNKLNQFFKDQLPERPLSVRQKSMPEVGEPKNALMAGGKPTEGVLTLDLDAADARIQKMAERNAGAFGSEMRPDGITPGGVSALTPEELDSLVSTINKAPNKVSPEVRVAVGKEVAKRQAAVSAVTPEKVKTLSNGEVNQLIREISKDPKKFSAELRVSLAQEIAKREASSSQLSGSSSATGASQSSGGTNLPGAQVAAVTGKAAPCPEAEGECPDAVDTYNKTGEALQTAKKDFKEAVEKATKTAEAVNRAAMALDAAKEKNPKGGSEVAQAEANLEAAKKDDANANEAQKKAKEELDKTQKAFDVAKAELDKCDEKAKEKCEEKTAANNPAQTPGNNAVGGGQSVTPSNVPGTTAPQQDKDKQAAAGGQAGGGSAVGAGGAGAGPATGGNVAGAGVAGGANVVGVAGGGEMKMTCKRSDDDCADLGRKAARLQLAAIQAKDELSQVSTWLSEADSLDRDAISLRVIANYQKAEEENARANALRAKAKSAPGRAEALEKQAVEVWNEYYACLQLHSCPKDFAGGGTRTTEIGFANCPKAKEALDSANFWHEQAAKDLIWAKQELQTGTSPKSVERAESWKQQAALDESSAKMWERQAAYLLEECNKKPTVAEGPTPSPPPIFPKEYKVTPNPDGTYTVVTPAGNTFITYRDANGNLIVKESPKPQASVTPPPPREKQTASEGPTPEALHQMRQGLEASGGTGQQYVPPAPEERSLVPGRMDRNIPSDPRKWTDAKQKMYSDRFPPGDYPQANGMIMRVLGNGDVIWVDGKTGHQLLLKDDPRTHKTVYVDSVTGKAIGEAGMVVESKKEVADPRKWADVPQAYEPQRRPGDYAGSDGLTMRVGQGGSVTWIDPKTGHILLPKVDPKTGVTVHVDSETGQIVRRQVSLTGQSPGSSMQEEGPNLDSLSKMRQNVEGAPGSR